MSQYKPRYYSFCEVVKTPKLSPIAPPASSLPFPKFNIGSPVAPRSMTDPSRTDPWSRCSHLVSIVGMHPITCEELLKKLYPDAEVVMITPDTQMQLVVKSNRIIVKYDKTGVCSTLYDSEYFTVGPGAAWLQTKKCQSDTTIPECRLLSMLDAAQSAQAARIASSNPSGYVLFPPPPDYHPRAHPQQQQQSAHWNVDYTNRAADDTSWPATPPRLDHT